MQIKFTNYQNLQKQIQLQTRISFSVITLESCNEVEMVGHLSLNKKCNGYCRLIFNRLDAMHNKFILIQQPRV